MASRRKLAAWAGAIILAVSGAAPALAASGYEKEPVLSAKDLAAPELLKGPHFTVDGVVPVKGFIARFTIRSPFGKFDAHGLRMLPVRVNEVEALAKLDEVSKTREFTAAMGRAAVRPVTAAANMATRPLETVAGIPDGVGRFFGRVGLAGRRMAQAARTPGQNGGERAAEVGRRVGATAISVLGFEQERRRLAERLGVDPYTTNPVLSERLTSVAWVAFSGRLGVTVLTAVLVPYSEIMAAVSVTNRAIWDLSAADLLNQATAAFGRTGATPEQVRALADNPQYPLSVLHALAMGLERLQGVQGRDALVAFAATAQTQDEVNFVAGAVNMLARHHEAVAPLARVSAPGPIVGHTATGALVLTAPVDYLSWIAPLGQDVSRPELHAAQKTAVVSGQVSVLAWRNLTARGWSIDESFSIAAER